MASFQLPSDYNDVPSRIAEFRAKHPDGSLQQVALDFREVAGVWWVIYTAAAYRAADDPRPGHGTAWEQVPGKTPYTKDSEVQNAETAAWGRAIVAVLAADTKRGIASAEEVRNRQVDRKPAPKDPIGVVREVALAAGFDEHEFEEHMAVEYPGIPLDELNAEQLKTEYTYFQNLWKTRQMNEQQVLG